MTTPRPCTLADSGATRLRIRSRGHPHGIVLQYSPQSQLTFEHDVTGILYAGGDWQWNGRGCPRDGLGNRIETLEAWFLPDPDGTPIPGQLHPEDNPPRAGNQTTPDPEPHEAPAHTEPPAAEQ